MPGPALLSTSTCDWLNDLLPYGFVQPDRTGSYLWAIKDKDGGRKALTGRSVQVAQLMGMSFEWNRPVTELIKERFILTTVISLATLLFTWAMAIPIGIYSAVRQYSIGDYVFSFDRASSAWPRPTSSWP